MNEMELTTTDHDRGSAGLTYVYPVFSRRAGGLSIGINLNPNNACNWRCVYCQVPDLVPGSAPPIDVAKLEAELRGMLADVLHGTYLERHLPADARALKDIAFSGNGEPTSAGEFPEIVACVGGVMSDCGLVGAIDLVLITNGSLVHHEGVQRGLAAMAPLGGTVWFKLDSATPAGQARINNARAGPARSRKNLEIAAALCPTWIQTLMFAWKGEPPSAEERAAYLAFVRDLVRDRVPVRGVLLYGLARPSHQPEATQLSPLPRVWMETFARDIESAGLAVKLSV